MNWHGPLNLTQDGESIPPSDRIPMFLGHYDSRMYMTDTAYLDVGAGSFDADLLVTMVPPGHVGSLGSVGRYCQIGTCEIMALGHHRNDLPVNITWGRVSLFSVLAVQHGLEGVVQAKPIGIGNNVVISSGAKVHPGVKIGDGAVLGTMGMANRDIEPFAIYGGVPAKKIGERKPCQPWWDFSAAYIAENMANINELALTDGPHEWRVERPRFVYRRNPTGIALLGSVWRDVFTPIEQAPKPVLDYCTQALGDGPHYWLADCWAAV